MQRGQSELCRIAPSVFFEEASMMRVTSPAPNRKMSVTTPHLARKVVAESATKTQNISYFPPFIL
jgi:hypothetical protein